MRPMSETVEQVYMWRLRTQKVMVRLLQQSQHAQSAVGAPKAVYTMMRICNQLFYTTGEESMQGDFRLPAALLPTL